MSLCTRRTDCRLCGSKNLELVIKLAPTPPANAFVTGRVLNEIQPIFPLDVFFCNSCHHTQLLDVVNAPLLFSEYPYVSGTSPSFVKHFESYVEFLCKKFSFGKGSKAFEIGSNDGTMLRFFKQNGLHTLGIDPARAIAQGASDSGILTINGYFTEETAVKIRNEYGTSDVIVANNVFAHIDDLCDVTKGIKSLLAKNGVFAFEVSYLLDVTQKTLFDTIYHEHLSYHSVLSLKPFFEKFDLELIQVHRVSTHGGSIRGIVQHKGDKHKPDGSVETLIALEENSGLNNSMTLKNLSHKISALKFELTSLIKSIKSSGKVIAGFGAPAKATTLMHEFGLDKSMIEFIVDDSPMKQGLFTPGLHIPVLPVEALYERRPDYAIILAWNFAEQIIMNQPRYISQGGKFITPIPKVITCP